MDYEQNKKLRKKYPVLKGRSTLSKRKIADSYMDISTKLFAVVFVSLISVPLAVVLKSILSGQPPAFDLQSFVSNLDGYLGILTTFLFLGCVLGYFLRRWALDIYDSLES